MGFSLSDIGDYFVAGVQIVAGIVLIASSGGTNPVGWALLASGLSSGYQIHDAKRKAKNAKQAWEDSLRDIKRMVKAPAEARSLILGTERVSGPILFADSFGAKKEKITLVVALAGHECDAIPDVYFNDSLLTLDGSGRVVAGDFSKGSQTVTVTQVVSNGASVTPPNFITSQGIVSRLMTDATNASLENYPGVWTVQSATYLSMGPASGYGPNGELVNAVVTGTGPYTFTGSSFANGGSTIKVVWQVVTSVAAVAKITKYLGAPGQVASPSMITNFPGKWTAAHKLSGITYLEIELTYDQDIFGQTGLPNVSAVVRGAKVFNYATGTTAYSNNAALCIAHWLRHPTLGAAAASDEIITAEMQTAQALCAEQVQIGASTFQDRYTIDGAIFSDTAPNDTKQKLEEAIGGTIVWSEGRWLIRPGAYRAPSYTLTESDLAGGYKIIPSPSRQSVYNRVIGNYVNPAESYASKPAPEVTNSTYVTEDNGIDLLGEVTFPFCKDAFRAQRLAKLILDRSRNATVISVAAKLHVYDQVLSDSIAVTWPEFGLSAVPFEVVSRTLDLANKSISLTLQLTGASLYTWNYLDASAPITLPSFNLPSASIPPVPVTGLTATTIEPASASQVGLSIVRFSWTSHPDAFVINGGYISIFTSTPQGLNLLQRVPGSTTSIEVLNLPWGVNTFVVIAENTQGRKSTDAVFNLTLAPDTNAPATPTNFVANITQGGVTLTWDDPRLVTGDYKESEIRVGGTDWATSSFAEFTSSTEFLVVWPAVGSYTYRIKHYDWSSNVSGEATQVVNITAANTAVQWTNVAGTGRPADGATSDLSLTASANVTVTGNTIARTTGGGAWDAGFYSRDAYVGGAFVSFRVGAVVATMVGLNTNPSVDHNYTGIDYAMYVTNAGALQSYINGALSLTLAASGVTTTDTLGVSYDGVSVRWTRNGTVLQTLDVVIAGALYLDASMSDATSKVTDLKFGPLTSPDWQAVKSVPYSTIFNNDEATALGFNPVFAAWAGSVPDGYTGLTGAAPTKETSLTRIGANAVRFNGCVNDNRYFSRTAMFGAMPAGTWVHGSYDVFIPAWTSGSPLLLIDLLTNSAGTTSERFQVPLGAANASVTGIWQRVPFSLRLASGQIHGIRIYIMGSWTSAQFTGDVIFDNLRFMFADANTDTVPIANQTENYRTDAAPTNNAAFGSVTSVATADGNILVSVPYTYTQGALPADFLYIFSREGAGTVVASDYAVMSDPVSGTHYFTVKPNISYTFGLQAGRRTDSGLKLTSILTSSTLAGTANNYTGNIQGTSALAIKTAADNFNARNDQDATPVVAPTITNSMVAGTKAVEHTLNADGSVDISFEWAWAGNNVDIDGFKVYIRQANAGGAYTMGSVSASETVYTVPAEKRAMIFYGLAANKFYYFGVRAYRIVDPIVNTNEIMETTIVVPPTTSPLSYPYQPETSVVFGGDITGSVGGIPVADINQWDAIAGAGKPHQYYAFSTGSSQTTAPAGYSLGLRNVDDAIQLLPSPSRSYGLALLDRATGALEFAERYDVYAGNVAGNIYPINLILWSEDFSNAAWVSDAPAVTRTLTAGVVLEDGTTGSVYKLTEANTSSPQNCYQGAVMSTAAFRLVYFDLKAGERSLARVSVGTASLAAGVHAIFDLSAGTIVTAATLTGTATLPGGSISALGNGWYRCAVWCTFAAAATVYPAVYIRNANSTASYAGTAGSGIYVRRSQLQPVAGVKKPRLTTTAIRYLSAQDLADDLNAGDSSQLAIVTTADEPFNNRLTAGLDTAIYRCGGSAAVFGSANFKSRGAYILIGIPGCGQGNGYESYAGDVTNDPNSWALVSFTLQNGLLNVSGQGSNPRALTDYGYVGDLDATNNAIYQQAAAPTGTISDGSIWIDTDDKNKTYYRSAGAWVLRRDSDIQAALDAAAASQAAADGKIDSFYQAAAPSTGMAVGDLWFDTDDSNKLYRYSGSAWVAATDTRIASALTNAQTAQDTADGKVTTFFSTATPTADAIGDLWYSSTTLVLQRWNGTVWASVSTHGAPAGTLVNGVAVATITTAVTNFNASNDRNTAAVVAPTLPGSGACIDHTGVTGANSLNTDGSVDISFEWAYAGAVGDIDGFMVYVYQSHTSGAYDFGTTPAAETVYTVPASKTAFILFGVPANKYYTFGVRSYRSIDKSLGDGSGVVWSAIVQSAFGGEDPYQPNANVAFAGNITGTVNNIPAANINVWASVTGAGKPADNATVGAVWGTNLTGRPANLASLTGSEGIQNSLITLSAGGVLGNAGGGTLDLSQINGTIVAGQIVANSIAASKLTLTSLANLLENPNFELGATAGWTLQWAGTAIVNDLANAHAGNWVLTSTTTVADQVVIALNNMLTAVVPGQTYHLSGFVKASAGTNGTAEWRITWLNAAAGVVSTTTLSWTPSTTYTQKVINAVAPATAVTARIEVVRRLQTAGTWYWDSPRFCPAAAAELIVDGSISTQHLAADSVTANKLSVTTGGENLVPNGSFDYRPSGNQPGGYSAYNNGAASVTWMDVTGSNGTGKAFALRADSAVNNVFGLHTGSAIHSGTIYAGGVRGGWKPQTTYMVAFMAKKVNGAGWTNMGFAWNTAPASTVSVQGPTLSTSWQRYVARITTGASVEAQGRLYITATPSVVAINDEIHIDELTVTEGDVEVAYAPRVTELLPGTIQADHMIAGLMSADNVLTRGLTVRDASGNVILSSGTDLDFSRVGGTGRPADNATSNLTLVASANATVTGNTVTKTSGAATTWDTSAYSRDGYIGGVTMSCRVKTITLSRVMIGISLTSDAAASNSYTDIDYCFYTDGTTTVKIYQNGAGQAETATIGIGSLLTITYDGTSVRYYVNGTVIKTVNVNITAAMSLDMSLYDLNTSSIEGVQFGPYGNPSAVSPNNRINSGNVTTFIDNAAINNAQIGNIIKSSNYEMYNLIKDFVANPSTSWVMTVGAGLTDLGMANSIVSPLEAGAITGYRAVWGRWGGTSGGGYLSSLSMSKAAKPVNAGDVVEAHAYLQCVFGTARLMIAFANAAGSVLATTLVSGTGSLNTMAAATATLTSNIGDFAHLQGFATAPANTTQAWIVIQVARTSTGGNTKAYINIPSLAVVMDSATSPHTWPSASGAGGAGWILNKVTGMELNAVNLRGKLTAEQIEVGAASANLVFNFKHTTYMVSACVSGSGTVVSAIAENVTLPANTLVSYDVNVATNATDWYSLAFYNWISSSVDGTGAPKVLHFIDTGVHNAAGTVNLLKRASMSPAGTNMAGIMDDSLTIRDKFLLPSVSYYSWWPAAGGTRSARNTYNWAGDFTSEVNYPTNITNKVDFGVNAIHGRTFEWHSIIKESAPHGIAMMSQPFKTNGETVRVRAKLAASLADAGVYVRLISTTSANLAATGDCLHAPYDVFQYGNASPLTVEVAVTDIIDVSVDVDVSFVADSIFNLYDGLRRQYYIDTSRLTMFMCDKDILSFAPSSAFAPYSGNNGWFGGSTGAGVDLMENTGGFYTQSVVGLVTAAPRAGLSVLGTGVNMTQAVLELNGQFRVTRRIQVSKLTTQTAGTIKLSLVFGGALTVVDAAGNSIKPRLANGAAAKDATWSACQVRHSVNINTNRV